MSKIDKFYAFLLTLSEETRIAYALFTAVRDQENTVVDNVLGLCLIIHEYREIYDTSQPSEKFSSYYEGVITKLDTAINGRDPGAIVAKQHFEKLIKSIVAFAKL